MSTPYHAFEWTARFPTCPRSQKLSSASPATPWSGHPTRSAGSGDAWEKRGWLEKPDPAFPRESGLLRRGLASPQSCYVPPKTFLRFVILALPPESPSAVKPTEPPLDFMTFRDILLVVQLSSTSREHWTLPRTMTISLSRSRPARKDSLLPEMLRARR